LIRSLKLTNFLSFGPEAEAVELRKLNVLIGPNGSGKSNFLEGFALLRAAPLMLTKPIRDGGGVDDWLWKPMAAQSGTESARLEAVVEYSGGADALKYSLEFSAVSGRFYLEDECIDGTTVFPNPETALAAIQERSESDGMVGTDGRVLTFYRLKDAAQRRVGPQEENFDLDRSILSQLRGGVYPEITFLAREFFGIRLYRDWVFGRNARPRLAQRADAAADFLEPDSSNLGLILGGFDPSTKRRVVAGMRPLYAGIESVETKIYGGQVRVVLVEGDREIPATRLSDGTLRYLSLLAVLCHPNPPSLLVIEEPELGLHPDVLPTLATLLRDASERTQLVVTTHSTMLVDALSDFPDAVLVCERDDDGTHIQRLDPKDLAPWLGKYGLGDLWTRGDLGGNRW
jgi:predicted ATPase